MTTYDEGFSDGVDDSVPQPRSDVADYMDGWNDALYEIRSAEEELYRLGSEDFHILGRPRTDASHYMAGWTESREAEERYIRQNYGSEWR